MDYKTRYTKIDADRVNQRIDNYLLGLIKGVPKTHIYRLLRTGQVRVNSKRVKWHYRLQSGDRVRIPPIRQAEALAHIPVNEQVCQTLARSILYEDDKLIVVNKPAGLASHRGSEIRYGLIDVIRQIRSDAPCIELVHRLDRDTSGCQMIAKDRLILRDLHRMLHDGLVKKTYLALVKNRWNLPKTYAVTQPLEKGYLRSGERLVKSSPTGKRALTVFKLLKQFKDYSLVRVYPHTGRMHQIRVHAANIGHPIIGDTKYGDHTVNDRMRKLGYGRLFLHAFAIKVTNQSIHLSVHAPSPSSFRAIWHKLMAEEKP